MLLRPSALVRLVLLPALLAGCIHTAPPVSGVAGGTGGSIVDGGTVAPVSFENESARVSALLPTTSDADQRDRLYALRELLEGMRGKDPTTQRVVRDYVDKLLSVEERGRPVVIGEGGDPVAPVITEEQLVVEEAPPLVPVPPPVPPALDAARGAMTAAHYDEAIALLATISASDPAAAEAAALRKTAVDEWARTTREKAGEAFQRAQKLPRGPDRTAALTAARTQLAAINEKYPENSYAQQIRDNIARVDVELAAP